MADQRPQQPSPGMVPWPVFADGSRAILLLQASGDPAVVLTAKSDATRAKAIDAGFHERSGRLILLASTAKKAFPDAASPANALTRLLGGVSGAMTQIPRDEFLATYCFRPQPAPGPSAAAPSPPPAEAPVETPAAHSGQDVSRDGLKSDAQDDWRNQWPDRAALKAVAPRFAADLFEDEKGERWILPATPAGYRRREVAANPAASGDAAHHAAFLRVRHKADLDALVERVIDTRVGQGVAPVSEEEMRELALAAGVSVRSLATSCVAAMTETLRLAQPASASLLAQRYVSTFPGLAVLAVEEGGITPAVALAATRFLNLENPDRRRIDADDAFSALWPIGWLNAAPAANTRTSRQDVAAQAVEDETARFDDDRPRVQAIDMTDASLVHVDAHDADAQGVIDEILTRLAGRDNDGRSLILLRGDVESPAVVELRKSLGRLYAVEGSVEIPPLLAGPVHNDNLVAISVGRRRPEPMFEAPEAGMRASRAASFDDLWTFSASVLRARGRVAEFYNETDAQASRQSPYVALSRCGEARTMTPRTLETAQRAALEKLGRDLADQGGLDASLAARFGVPAEDLGRFLSPEQADAIGLAMNAVEKGRAFLTQDATGVGKGRSLAGISSAWVRSGATAVGAVAENDGAAADGAQIDDGVERPKRKVIYVTESGEINAPDVLRDLQDTGRLDDFRIAVVANKCAPGEVPIGSLSSKARADLFMSGEWGDYNFAVMTYSQFNREDAAAADWAIQVTNEDVMVILDESHNALSQDGNTGVNIRAVLERAGAQIFASATPLRPGSNFSLYERLLPPAHRNKLANFSSSSLEMQEILTSMLVEDGVVIRRDHNLGDLTIRQDLPSETRDAWYDAQVMRLQPVIRGVLEIGAAIRDHMDRANLQARREIMRRHPNMADNEVDRRLRELNGNSQIFGPLEQIVGGFMIGMKLTAPQPGAEGEMGMSHAVATAMDAIARGRKPIISLKMTAGSFLDAFAELDRAPIAGEGAAPDFRDFAARSIERLWRRRLNGDMRDLREIDPNLQAMHERVMEAVRAMPVLPASPIDALIDDLEARGVSVAEVTGRSDRLRGGVVVARDDTAKRAAIDAFNSGEKDAIIINAAGSTGGSMHASPKFADQRPRTKVEVEIDSDIVKHIQGLGRGHRYGQLHGLEVVTVLTGLLPEIRRASIANSKLARLGAVVEANRDHPLRDTTSPDMVNTVGDQVATVWLARNPDVAASLEIPVPTINGDEIIASEVQHGLMNRLLSRMIVLPPERREAAFEALVAEFEFTVDELDSRNMNPLRPKYLPGRFVEHDSMLYSGTEGEIDSVFDAPVYLTSGHREIPAAALSGKMALKIVEREAAQDSGVFQEYAGRVEQARPDVLRLSLPHGEEITPETLAAHPRARREAERLDALIDLLNVMAPGRVITRTNDNTFEPETCIVAKTVEPKDSFFGDTIPAFYKVDLVAPGYAQPVRANLGSLLRDREFTIGGNVLEMDDLTPVEEAFDNASAMIKEVRSQTLTGNLFEAAKIAGENNLGKVVFYENESGARQRGVVVPLNKIDLTTLPVEMSAACGLSMIRHYNGQTKTLRDGKDYKGSVISVLPRAQNASLMAVTLPPYNLTYRKFWDTPAGRQLWAATHEGKALPDKPEHGNRARVRASIPFSETSPLGDLFARVVDEAGVVLKMDGDQNGMARAFVGEWMGRQAANARPGELDHDTDDAEASDAATRDAPAVNDGGALIDARVDENIEADIDADVDFDERRRDDAISALANM